MGSQPINPHDLDPHLREFEEAVSGEDEDIDLARAALVASRIEHPDLELEPILDSLNALAARAVARFSPFSDPLEQVQVLNSVLIDDFGLRGASKNYYDPRNSYLNEILERKIGIPVSLAILYMSVGHRAGVALAGTAVPMHFLVRVLGVQPPHFVDVFGRGRILSQERASVGIGQMLRGKIEFEEDMLDVVSNRAVITRLLTNLKMIYLNAMKFYKAVQVLDRIIVANPWEPTLLRERGLVRFRLGQSDLARVDLERYLDEADEPEDAGEIRNILRRITP